MAWENEYDFPRPKGNPAEEGFPPWCSGLPFAKANIKLAVHLSSDGAGVYSSSWVPDEETE